MIRVHTVCYKDGLWLVMSGKCNFMLTSMANIPVQPNIWDKDQTAPMRSGSILIASKTSFNTTYGSLCKENATYAYVNGQFLRTDKHCGPGSDCS